MYFNFSRVYLAFINIWPLVYIFFSVCNVILITCKPAKGVNIPYNPPTVLIVQFLSIQNWIEDLLWKQLDLDYPGMPEAMVSIAKIL